jgi:hypothetical protein
MIGPGTVGRGYFWVMSDEAKGHGPVQRSLPDAGTAEPLDVTVEQADRADRRKIVVDTAHEIAQRSAQLNARLRER